MARLEARRESKIYAAATACVIPNAEIIIKSESEPKFSAKFGRHPEIERRNPRFLILGWRGDGWRQVLLDLRRLERRKPGCLVVGWRGDG
ncbi:MAG: hypothetical protein ABSE69_19565 [Roseiarcus sp.]|jgi:hypothetical protein